jgi:hypothetical protein
MLARFTRIGASLQRFTKPLQVVFTHCNRHLRCRVAWCNTSSYMQMQKAVRLLPVAKQMRLLLAAALLEEGESLVHCF